MSQRHAGMIEQKATGSVSADCELFAFIDLQWKALRTVRQLDGDGEGCGWGLGVGLGDVHGLVGSLCHL